MEPPQHLETTEAQRRHLFTTLRYVDRLLTEAWALMTQGPGDELVPRYQGKASDETIRRARPIYDQIRTHLREMLERLPSENAFQPIDVIHSALVSLDYSGIALEECKARVMKGYGAVDDRTDRILVDWSDRLQGEVRELARVLEADRAYQEEDPAGPEDAIRS
jgi:hypothetical protein